MRIHIYDEDNKKGNGETCLTIKCIQKFCKLNNIAKLPFKISKISFNELYR